MKKRWQILQPDPQSIETLCKTLNCHRATAAALVNRKITSAKKALVFLNAALNHLRPPADIKDMDAAVRRIVDAVIRHEHILIFGDYDVDGVTATAILLEFFRYIGTKVSYYIPHRAKEGYGLQVNHISEFARPRGITLIITVDCGSGSHDAVKAAQAAGIDVIITDHHIPPGNLPQAVAVVNPKRSECTSGFNDLAGVGVAFYMLLCLRKQLRDINFWQNRPQPNLKKVCDLVALGTLADMVPLVDENRILSKNGLDIINTGDRLGIKALLNVSGIQRHAVDAEDMVFRLIPRLNAAGRLDHASMGVDLLTTKNFATASKIAQVLSDLNEKRRSLEKTIFDQIRTYLKSNPHLLQKKTLILSGNDWHEGVLGIVAARIVNEYFRPVILLSTSGDIARGSARSIPGFDIYKGLQACAHDLESFGGHSMAAGLKIHIEKIARFQKNFEGAVIRMTNPDDFILNRSIDYELDFDEISNTLIDELESLKPFGTGNHEPIFLARNIKVTSSAIVGNYHRRMLLKRVSGTRNNIFKAIHYNIRNKAPLPEILDRIVFRLRWNRWNDRKTAQIVIDDTSPNIN
ncbi:MAG: single-stranded-DNA-specific exonuclease RecJ [Pseudomonadota bacterium]|nr:single-stranded-DNA-specific exonuclease RecJ [Pseudomonadota bacterium]